jgi:integrase
LDNLAKRVIRPALSKAGIEWRGWHAFRRGLATNLKQIGVDDKTIQAILRHADYSTTMNSYVQAMPESVHRAMERYEQLVLCPLNN